MEERKSFVDLSKSIRVKILRFAVPKELLNFAIASRQFKADCELAVRDWFDKVFRESYSGDNRELSKVLLSFYSDDAEKLFGLLHWAICTLPHD